MYTYLCMLYRHDSDPVFVYCYTYHATSIVHLIYIVNNSTAYTMNSQGKLCKNYMLSKITDPECRLAWPREPK